MDIRAVAFDVNGTLISILADDDEERIFRAAAHFLTYQGVDLHRHEVRDLYFRIMKEQQLPVFLAEMSRGISRRRLGLYPCVREVLDVLRDRYPLAIVTDAQSLYAPAELHKVGLLGYFDPIVVSGDHWYRKPDRRLFQLALDGMGVPAGNTLFVGNDMYRDVYGAREAGLKTVMFDSDQGAKAYLDCVPDYTITDFRDLLKILGLPGPDWVA
jgi:putative hydrolase of the HAD superfamily